MDNVVPIGINKKAVDYPAILEEAKELFEYKDFDQAFIVLQSIKEYVYSNPEAAYLLYELTMQELSVQEFSNKDCASALENAALVGAPQATVEMAYYCEYGNDPHGVVKQDLSKAYAWYQKAKDSGEDVSVNLAELSLQISDYEKQKAAEFHKEICH